MNSTGNSPSGDVRLYFPRSLRFLRLSGQPTVAGHSRAVSQWWSNHAPAASFDGPIVAVPRVVAEPSSLALHWFEGRYSSYAASRRKVPGVSWTPILYVSVIVRTERGIVLGVMAQGTDAGRRVQLPGGNVDPHRQSLSEDYCRREAIRELQEEVGLNLEDGDLSLFAVKVGGDNGDVGIFFSTKVVYDSHWTEWVFNAHQRGLGSQAELEGIVFCETPDDASGFAQADYVRVLLELDSWE